ncbi:hypothetical protein [Micromonospora luteifusca]|uniref:hypothetical protein n=1 Tax=Micromonospora luteifusca TaxID=709860 RepID=UPI001EF851C4|nr:hypothetical protein [Micromonospora luteifusca]
MPYVTAVVAAYGKETVAKIHDSVIDQASDATVGLGRRLLDRILRREESRPLIEGALVDVADGEQDAEAALRLQIRKALTADPQLAEEVVGMLPGGATHIEASGDRSIAIGHNSGVASTGDHAMIQR